MVIRFALYQGIKKTLLSDFPYQGISVLLKTGVILANISAYLIHNFFIFNLSKLNHVVTQTPQLAYNWVS